MSQNEISSVVQWHQESCFFADKESGGGAFVKMSKFGIVLLFALHFYLPLSALAKNLYVNNSGNPACSDATTYLLNSANTPWCTIGRAAWGSTNPNAGNNVQAAQAGDVVLITQGTYLTTGPQSSCSRWGVALNPVNSGTSGAPIVFQGIGDVRIYLAAGYAGPTIGANLRNYIIWDHVQIDEQIAQGLSCGDTGPVVFHESIGSKILNSNIRGTYKSWSDNYCGIRAEATSQITIANNNISNFTGNWGHNDAAIMTYDAANSIIEHNIIHDSQTCIFLKGDHAGDSWPQENNIVRFNLFENCTNKSLFLIAGNGSRIYQNIFKLGAQGMGFKHDGSNISDVVFANNTIIKTSGTGDVGYSVSSVAPTVTNFRIFNNIFYGSFAEDINLGDSPAIGGQSFEHNIYFGSGSFGSLNGALLSLSTWKTTFGKDNATPASTSIDPQFLDLISFKLQPSSPARVLGVDILDLNNNGSAVDIVPAGAYITGNEVIGVSSGAPPSTGVSKPLHFRILQTRMIGGP